MPKWIVALLALSAIGYYAYDHRGDELSVRALTEGNKVVVYGIANCGFCERAKAQLNKANVPFEEILIERPSADRTRLFERLHEAGYRSGTGLPILDVNGTLIVPKRKRDINWALVEPHLKYAKN